MVSKVIFAFLMSFATASLVTIAHIFYKDISYELIFDTYIYAMKISRDNISLVEIDTFFNQYWEMYPEEKR